MALFKKVACFTDIHFGLKSNSQTHNQDCEDFVDWFITEAKKAGCETCIFLGDWHHNRNSISLVTLDASLRCLEKLGAAFDFQVIMICSIKTSVTFILVPLVGTFQELPS